MRILDIPQSGKRGLYVTQGGRYGQISRTLVIPSNPRTAPQMSVRAILTRVTIIAHTRLQGGQASDCGGLPAATCSRAGSPPKGGAACGWHQAVRSYDGIGVLPLAPAARNRDGNEPFKTRPPLTGPDPEAN